MTELRLEDIASEEACLGFPAFDAQLAWRVGSWIRDRACDQNLPIAIEVSVAEHVLFHVALPGATPDNAEWIRRKRNTVMRFRRSSLAMRLLCEAKGKSLSERYGLPDRDYVASGGGVPIILTGTGCIGAVVVSGLPDVEDHALVVSALRAFQP